MRSCRKNPYPINRLQQQRLRDRIAYNVFLRNWWKFGLLCNGQEIPVSLPVPRILTLDYSYFKTRGSE